MRRPAVALACCGLLLVACTDSGTSTEASVAPPDSASTTGAASSTTALVDDSIVSRYLAALDAGDVDAANALRCNAGRVPADAMDQFAQEAAALKAAAGGTLASQQQSIVEPITLGSLYGERPDAQVAFSLATPDGPSSLVAVAVITEDGEPRLCGEMQ